MASIQKAAEKPIKQRKPNDNVLIMAGHMLTFDYLVQQDIAERQIARKVVRKSLIRSAGCLSLPLTIVYFGAYVTAARLHEDITNVFFLESGIRWRTDGMFVEANTVQDLWGALLSPAPGNFLDVFFNHRDMYGNLQQKNVSETQWGDWGLVSGFNQIQGAVRFTQERVSTDKFQEPFNCSSYISCNLCWRNEGFQTVETYESEPPRVHDCGPWGTLNAVAQTDSIGQLVNDSAHSRRLHLGRPELRTSFKPRNLNEQEQFRFWLYPSETTEETRERLMYFYNRNWINEGTNHIQIKMYLMNAELGRNRLEQLTLRFYMSYAGSIYYERDLQTLFLKFHQGALSMFADFCFFIILLLTTGYRLWGMWKAFLSSKLFLHLMNLHTAWEWVLILIGWWNIYGFYKMYVWEGEVVDVLGPVHNQGWTIGPADEEKVVALFDVASTAATGLANLRVVFAQYSVVLMFRFFVSFGSQPRLAIVLKTLRNVLVDFFHFLIVFLPTFMAYVISGSLMFGRRVEAFATIQSSFGACFRIAMESEYDWAELSEEYFVAAALWSWTFMLLVVLLFLNMVLAIILDIYNETRAMSFPGEAVWETISTILLRTYRYRTWVKDKALHDCLTENMTTQSMVTRRDLSDQFPNMPDSQKDLFFNACRTEMKWESAKDLTKKNLLKLTGTIMDSVDAAHATVTRVTKDEAKEPLQSWMSPLEPLPNKDDKAVIVKDEKGNPLKEHYNFLSHIIRTKGGKEPLFEMDPSLVEDAYSENGPEWLQETWALLREQRKWIEYANWHLQQMQWQIQRAHESKASSGLPKAANGAAIL